MICLFDEENNPPTVRFHCLQLHGNKAEYTHCWCAATCWQNKYTHLFEREWTWARLWRV